MFVGRKTELQQLKRLKDKHTSSLVCILGRRRVGKSSLIEEFGKSFKNFISIQGLGPESKVNNQIQLDNFAEQLSLQLNERKQLFSDWTEAFVYLSERTKEKEILILLDEISWMGKEDPNFATKLKAIWDMNLKKNSKLILVLCGSVSTWIDTNILNNTAFEGRVSLSINLQQLSLLEINEFLKQKKNHFGNLEKLLILSVTGGIPKYLEEISNKETAEQNIINMCFKPSGLLFKDYDVIFSSIFNGRKKTLEKIVSTCLSKKLSVTEIAKKLNKLPDSNLSELINILELSGFVSKDYNFDFEGKIGKSAYVRIKDNYLRFYLKYIKPVKEKIESNSLNIKSLSSFDNLSSILGYQFENLMLNNRELIYSKLNIPDNDLVVASPHFQKETKVKKTCQIDLLIQTKLDIFYLCEFKCQKTIKKSIIKEVQEKEKRLKLPKRSALKPVLVYQGELENEEAIKNYFYKTIEFSELFEN